MGSAADRSSGWLIDACSAEIRTHRILFFGALVPVLGLWLPCVMTKFGVSVAEGAILTAAGAADESRTTDWHLTGVAGVLLPLIAFVVGHLREFRRQASGDRAARALSLKMPERQGKRLLDVIADAWSSLGSAAGGQVPGVILRRSLGISAHAYDDRDGRTIEVSAGLATRIVRDDPLALAIIRHEIAHLVNRDLPKIRGQACFAAASAYAAMTAILTCWIAVATVLATFDLVRFPLDWTAANILAVHAAAVLATVLVTLPLLLGLFVMRRYAGFLVALAETRADVSAGLWGGGLTKFAAILERDPTVKHSTIQDVGLSYVSPWLSHLSARERVALLQDPARIATPKLRYFAVAVTATWFLTFHQGNAIWDFLLLCMTVALVQAVTVLMALTARGEVRISPSRACWLGAGLSVCQALPLVSVEGLAYLSQHLTAAIVRPGGFGSAEGVDYMKDTADTFSEFFRHVHDATGGVWFGLSVLLSAVSLGRLFLLRPLPHPRRSSLPILAVTAVTFLTSVAVSYHFFQEALYRQVRTAAFALSDLGADPPETWWGAVGSVTGRSVSWITWMMSEWLNGTPILGSVPWLRLSVPTLVAAVAATLVSRLIGRASPGVSPPLEN